jgi:hypothetical protein
VPRGRKSEASAYLGGPFIPAQRPEPPADLQPPEAKDEWRAIVSRMPAEWFPQETFGILHELCAHHVYARWIREGIQRVKEACEKDGIDWALDQAWSGKLAQMWAEHRYQTQQIGKLSASLRLTNKARYSPERAHDEREKVAAVVGPKTLGVAGRDTADNDQFPDNEMMHLDSR